MAAPIVRAWGAWGGGGGRARRHCICRLGRATRVRAWPRGHGCVRTAAPAARLRLVRPDPPFTFLLAPPSIFSNRSRACTRLGSTDQRLARAFVRPRDRPRAPPAAGRPPQRPWTPAATAAAAAGAAGGVAGAVVAEGVAGAPAAAAMRAAMVGRPARGATRASSGRRQSSGGGANFHMKKPRSWATTLQARKRPHASLPGAKSLCVYSFLPLHRSCPYRINYGVRCW